MSGPLGYSNEGTILCPACAARRAVSETPISRDVADGTELCDVCHQALSFVREEDEA
jgi:uncharacterized Zn finger protein (UPF0148 family)